MQFIRERVLAGEVMMGIGANLGSSLTVEMIGAAGFDWTWIDCEHGAGDYSELIPQIQAASIYNAPAIVRIAWNEAPRFKRVLDLGAAGIMVPYVTSAAECTISAGKSGWAQASIRARRLLPRPEIRTATFNRLTPAPSPLRSRRWRCCRSSRPGRWHRRPCRGDRRIRHVGPLRRPPLRHRPRRRRRPCRCRS